MALRTKIASVVAVVAAAVGMGACSAHPGQAIVTTQGSYSISDLETATAQIGEIIGQKVELNRIRAVFYSAPQLDALAAQLRVDVTEAQIDQRVAAFSAAAGQDKYDKPLAESTKTVVRATIISEMLNQAVTQNPSLREQVLSFLQQQNAQLDPQVNPRFPTLDSQMNAFDYPRLGDVVSGSGDASGARQRTGQSASTD